MHLLYENKKAEDNCFELKLVNGATKVFIKCFTLSYITL